MLSFHHPKTTQRLRTMHQHLHSTALEMEHRFCGTVDEQSTGSSYGLNKGIQYTPFFISPDGLTVSSQLIVPTTKANNNITVICTVQDSLFNHQYSNPVKLYLQGTLNICMYSLILIDELHVQSISDYNGLCMAYIISDKHVVIIITPCFTTYSYTCSQAYCLHHNIFE